MIGCIRNRVHRARRAEHRIDQQRMVAQWSGMANPPKVFEVWNEPWLTSFAQPAPDAASYLKLVQQIQTEAKAALTRMTMAAALVMMPPLRSSPSATARVLSPVSSYASRTRESKKTS